MTKSRFAFNTALANLIKTAIVSAIFFLLTPVIIKFIGKNHYGFWVFLVQIVGYITWVDFLPGSALKLQIAHQHMKLEKLEKQRQIGAVVNLGVKSSILYIGGTSILLLLLPHLITIEGFSITYARLVLFCLALNIYIGKFSSIPQMVIRGVNRDYITSYFLSIFGIVFGMVDFLVVYFGGNLLGLALSKLTATFFIGCFFWLYTKKIVPWFEYKKPTLKELSLAKKQNIWLYGMNISSVLNNQFEIVLVGFLFSSPEVAIYATTSSLIAKLYQVYVQITNAVNPTIGNLFGEERYKDLQDIKKIMLKVHTIVGLTLFTSLLLFNKCFIYLWLGSSFYAGDNVNIMVLCMWLARIFLINSQRFYLITLKIKQATLFQGIGGLIFLLLLALFNDGKMYFIPVYIAIGCIIVIIISALKTPIKVKYQLPDVIKLILAFFICSASSYYVYSTDLHFFVGNWLLFFIIFIASSIFIVCIYSMIILRSNDVYKILLIIENIRVRR
jgi:O-antigen/teichoic acid export membrane protein